MSLRVLLLSERKGGEERRVKHTLNRVLQRHTHVEVSDSCLLEARHQEAIHMRDLDSSGVGILKKEGVEGEDL